jgi:hypothetical protein
MRIDLAHAGCQSGLCVQYALHSVSAAPICSMICDSAGDCPARAAGCSEGFACRVGQSIAGPLQCKKLCVCKRDVPSQQPDPQANNCAR